MTITKEINYVHIANAKKIIFYGGKYEKYSAYALLNEDETKPSIFIVDENAPSNQIQDIVEMYKEDDFNTIQTNNNFIDSLVLIRYSR